MNSLPLADMEKNTYSATNKLILTKFTITYYHLWWVIPLLIITFDEQRSKAINTFDVNNDSLDRPGFRPGWTLLPVIKTKLGQERLRLPIHKTLPN